MGEKDISEKVLEDYNDVFADIVNVLLFHGKSYVKEDELENVKDKSQYKTDEKLHEQERDVVKLWQKGERNCRIQLAMLGIENQTGVDRNMIFRVLGYDGAGYRKQLLDKNNRKRKERYPVITMVLYFGYKRHWKKRSLYEIMDIPEELRPYVNDYQLNVFEIAWLSEEQVEMFKSDFKIVADYFVQMRKNRKYVPSAETIRHVDEVFKMMRVLAKDINFEEEINRKITEKREKGEEMTMKGFLAEAREEGIEKGQKNMLINQVYKKMMKGQEPMEIAEELVADSSEVQKIYDLIHEELPGFDVDSICEKLMNIKGAV